MSKSRNVRSSRPIYANGDQGHEATHTRLETCLCFDRTASYFGQDQQKCLKNLILLVFYDFSLSASDGQAGSKLPGKCTTQYYTLAKAQELDACSNLRSWPEFLAIRSASNHILLNAVDPGELAGESTPTTPGSNEALIVVWRGKTQLLTGCFVRNDK